MRTTPIEIRSRIAHITENLEIGDELFWEPVRQVRPGAWTGHLATAFWLIKAVEPRMFVELGTHSGNSYLAFCQAIAHLGLSSRAFAVDTWQGDEHSGPIDDSVFRDLSLFNDRHFTGFSKLLRTTFDSAREYFADGSVDLLHIDGFHSYEVVKHDFEMWRGALSSKAVVVFHDTNVREREFGVWKLWKELCREYPSFEFYHSEGLGVLGVGEAQTPPLLRLFEFGQDVDDRALVQRLFASRGETFTERARSLDLTSDIAVLQKDVAVLEEKVANQAQTIAGVEQELARKEAVVRDQATEARLKDDLLRRLEKETYQKAEFIGDQGRTITAHERRIGELAELVAKERGEFAEAKKLLEDDKAQSLASAAELQQQIVGLQRELESFQRRLQLMQSGTTWKVTSRVTSALSDYPRLRRMGRRCLRAIWWTITFQLLHRLRARRELLDARSKIAASALFNAEWYLAHYSDAAAISADPALHYALFGAVEPLNPGPKFDSARYLQAYPDVASGRLNPLLHFLEYGAAEGRHSYPVLEVDGSGKTDELHREPSHNIEPVAQLDNPDEYARWVAQYDSLDDSDRAAIRRDLAELRNLPLISVIMPVYNTPPEFLRKALDSVIAQLYPHWELCIADDGSTHPEIRIILDEYPRRDRRIKVVYRSTNGHISAASNSALELATGTFIALMDHDDELPPHALYMVAHTLDKHPHTDIIYSDEDKIDSSGTRQTPYFKPDWNEELFYSQNYLSHLGVYRASLVQEVGGFREGYEGSQDYDLALRCIAKTTSDRIHHIPHVLYHWRTAPGVQTFSIDNLETAVQSSRRALADYFAARGETVQVTGGKLPQYNRVVREFPKPAPRVSLIVPTRDRVSMLRGCMEGILHRTSYDNFEVIVVDNDSCDPEAIEYLRTLQQHEGIRVLRVEGEFNYSAFNNRAIQLAEGELLGLINNDIQVIHPEWLQEMVAQLLQPGVGAVGAKLYYPDNTIQHAGVTLGLGGVAGHSHSRAARSDPGYFGRLQLVHEVSCVTGACLLLHKQAFLEVGGFDETRLKVAFNDVDLCIKLRRAGYKIVWTPYAELYHLESVSRGYDSEPAKADRFLREASAITERWGYLLDKDPFYNPNLSLIATSNHRLAFPPRTRKPWLHPGSDVNAGLGNVCSIDRAA